MWLIYLLMILNRVSTLFFVLSVIFGLCLAIFIILGIVGECEDPTSYDSFSEKAKTIFKKMRKISIWIFIPSLLIALLLPSSKQAAIIFTAGSAIDYVQNNEKIQELPDKATDCLNKFIDDYLNEDESNSIKGKTTP